MAGRNILYISGSLGLGHITRDLAIAKELRKQNPALKISWLSAHPASLLLKDAGENLLPEADTYANDNIHAENAAQGFQLNLLKYLLKARKAWAHNVKIFKQITSKEHFDVVIGDETYEIAVTLIKEPRIRKAPFVMIYDFCGLDSMTRNPLEKLAVYYWNRIWAQDYKLLTSGENIALFVGELEDIPDKSFGFFLPNRRKHARAHYKTLGYILSFDPAEYSDKKKVRAKLGYGDETLIICSIGGTSIGKDLLELCGKAYPILREQIPNLHMVLVCGPRLSTASLKVPQGVEIRQYVPSLYEHFAASDLAIVQGGGTITLELTALRRPFLYFPIEGHYEQEISVAGRLLRQEAGFKMLYSQTTPNSLAERVIANLGKEVNYAPIPIDGAEKAAKLITQLI